MTMLKNNADNVTRFTGDDVAVSLGTPGVAVTAPTSLSGAVAGLTEVGWLEEKDGVKMKVDRKVEEDRGLQGKKLIMKYVDETTYSITFTMRETTALSYGLLYGFPEITKTGEEYSFDPTKNGTTLVKVPLMVDSFTSDGKGHERLFWSAATIEVTGDVMLAGEARNYEVEATLVGGAETILFGNLPGVLADLA